MLYEIVDTLQKAKLSFAVVGGYALALHGIVRATMDVDLVLKLTLKDFELAESCLNQIGLQSRLPIRAQDVIKMRKEFINNRNLLAWSFVDYKNSSRQVDLLIAVDLKDLKIVKISVGGRKVPIASLKTLLEMKKKAGRPQDLVDIKYIMEKLNEKK